jgi:Uma2 family endonuclease
MSTKVEATIEDLYKVEGKAELVNGEIILMSPTGILPGYAGDEIFPHYANTANVLKLELRSAIFSHKRHKKAQKSSPQQ